MSEDIMESGSPVPGPDTFDFDDYISDASTFPEFEHTAYLNQKAGAELADVLDEIESSIEELAVIGSKIENRQKQSAGSFVDPTMDDLVEQRDELNERLEILIGRKKELTEAIKSKSLTLYFQVKTPDELGSVIRDATRQFHKDNPQFKNATDDNVDYMNARIRATLIAQIVHFCTGMKRPDGRTAPPPNAVQANRLMDSLISSEVLRLMESVSTGLSASRNWAEQLDAGFPGGSDDVEGERVDSDGSEDGEGVGSSPVDHSDRPGDGLEG